MLHDTESQKTSIRTTPVMKTCYFALVPGNSSLFLGSIIRNMNSFKCIFY